MFRKVGILLFVLVSMVSTYFGNINVSYAAVADGSDPIATGCANDAVTVRSNSHYDAFGIVNLELRYSPSCRSAWARISTNYTVQYEDEAPEGMVVRDQDEKMYSCYIHAGNTSCYTRQVNDAGYTSHAEGWAYMSYDNWALFVTGSY